MARIAELELEVSAQIETLAKLVADKDEFEENKEGLVPQAFGLLAVLGQGIAEHPERDKVPFQGPAVRDAALKFKEQSTLAESQAVLAAVHKAVRGEDTAEHAQRHDWDKLIGMYPLMEEMNGRNSEILRVLRRPRGTPQEGAHASVLGLLALAMYADTHAVEDKDQLPQWQAWATEYRESVVKMGDAIRAQDKEAARQWFDVARTTCDKCHDVFQ